MPGAPGGAGGMQMPAMAGMGGASKPRFRSLLKSASCTKGHIVDLKLYPRVPLNPQFYPHHIDES
jgi:hypothetical protein